jgi:hypothetical protein
MLSATGGGSRNPVTFASTTPAVCTTGGANGATVTLVAAGTCTITASQAGSGSYSAAPAVTQSFLIGKASQSIAFSKPADVTFVAGRRLSLTATGGASGEPVTFASTTPAVCTTGGNNGSDVALIAAGTCTITARQKGTASFAAAADISQSFSIVPAAQVITFPAPVGQPMVPGAQITLSATGGASGNPVIFSSTTSSMCTTSGLNGATVTLLAAGTCTITAVQSAGGSFVAAQVVTRSFTIAAKPVQIGLESSKSPLLIGEMATFTARISASAPPSTARVGARTMPVVPTGSVTFTSGRAPLCAGVPVSNGAASCSTAFTSAGQHTIIATYSGDGTFASATSSALTVAATDQTGQAVRIVGKYMSERANVIVSNQFRGDRQIDRLKEAEQPGATGGGAASSGLMSASRTGAAGFGMVPAASGRPEMRLGAGPRGEGTSPLFATPFGRRGGIGDDPLDNDNGTSFSLNGPAQFSGDVAGAGQFSFGTGLRQFLQFQREREQAKADAEAAALGGGALAFHERPAFMPLDIWIEGKYGGYKDRGSLDGHFGLVTLGADYVLSPSFLFGVYAQYDSMDYRSPADSTGARGQGWMAGPHATVRLAPDLFWQGRAAWGTSSNSVNPFGTSHDAFETSRWLAATSLAGRYTAGNWTFAPQAGVTYFVDKSDDYTDTYGVVMPGVTTSLGQFKAGPSFSYRLDMDKNFRIEPHFGAELIWNFDSKTEAEGWGMLAGDGMGPAGVRGRIEGGLRLQGASGLSVDLLGSYDGVGADGYRSISGRGALRVPLN